MVKVFRLFLGTLWSRDYEARFLLGRLFGAKSEECLRCALVAQEPKESLPGDCCPVSVRPIIAVA